MAQVKFVNRTKNAIVADTFVLLKRSRKQDHEYELLEDSDVIGLVVADVPAGGWGEATDLSTEPYD
jgi:hypothetical protein